MIKLTVAIPTYNRNIKAANQVRQLLEQIGDFCDREIELLVIDNASDTPLEASFKEQNIPSHPCLRLVRNPVNVGLSANIIRCFEHAQGEWLWLVGDDDELLPNALQDVLEVLEKSLPEIVHHKFSVDRATSSKAHDLTINSLSEICDHASDPWCFSNLLFITTSVYRRQDFLPYISTAYHWNAAVAPHLVCLFSALRDGKKARIHPTRIAKVIPAEGAERWNLIRLRMGLQTLAEIEGCEIELHRLFGALMQKWYGGWKLPLISILLCLRSNRPRCFWRMWYFRAAASTSFCQSAFQAILALFWAPIGCSKLVRSTVSKLRGTRNDTGGTARM